MPIRVRNQFVQRGPLPRYWTLAQLAPDQLLRGGIGIDGLREKRIRPLIVAAYQQDGLPRDGVVDTWKVFALPD